ncbi:hypothetical protein GOP47_0003447 [Adiantum capillus-veneris]|uniref:Serine-threonine/tyrosine-protein kinase catalytic domain-containing protein n=1 Tax=Adiantum capillus-veneris TaxID=13818 RepID=A0A9D4VCT8_ADICA|nr:hypothetical protein GOP47_0003447 [Adiantum capillus-veneris]
MSTLHYVCVRVNHECCCPFGHACSSFVSGCGEVYCLGGVSHCLRLLETYTKGDVYSFGIVLLELMTKKRATDALFTTMGVSLPMWVKDAYCDKTFDILNYSTSNLSLSVKTTWKP